MKIRRHWNRVRGAAVGGALAITPLAAGQDQPVTAPIETRELDLRKQIHETDAEVKVHYQEIDAFRGRLGRFGEVVLAGNARIEEALERVRDEVTLADLGLAIGTAAKSGIEEAGLLAAHSERAETASTRLIELLDHEIERRRGAVGVRHERANARQQVLDEANRQLDAAQGELRRQGYLAEGVDPREIPRKALAEVRRLRHEVRLAEFLIQLQTNVGSGGGIQDLLRRRAEYEQSRERAALVGSVARTAEEAYLVVASVNRELLENRLAAAAFGDASEAVRRFLEQSDAFVDSDLVFGSMAGGTAVHGDPGTPGTDASTETIVELDREMDRELLDWLRERPAGSALASQGSP